MFMLPVFTITKSASVTYLNRRMPPAEGCLEQPLIHHVIPTGQLRLPNPHLSLKIKSHLRVELKFPVANSFNFLGCVDRKCPL